MTDETTPAPKLPVLPAPGALHRVMLLPIGYLDAVTREKLEGAGWIALEVPDPSQVVQMIPMSTLVTGDDLLLSALKAVVDGGEGSRFVRELFGRLTAREKAAQ